MHLYFFAFLGGLALFLYGMQIMGEGLQKAAGNKMEKILEVLTGRIIYGVMLGAAVTALLQSSTATTVMTVGLVNAGLMTLKQAFGIVMGANIGTTVTAQLIAFKLTDFVTLIIAVGFVLNFLAKGKKFRYTGQILLGFGILLLGMGLMGDSVAPLKKYQGFVDFIQTFAENPLLGLLVGTLMTCVIQSSSATIGILMAMASQGLIPLEGAIPVLFGDNIGTCITAVIASARGNKTAKRVATSHVLFNVIGSVVFIIFLDYYTKLVIAISPAGDIARQIANAHTAFNVMNTLLFLPFAEKFISFVQLLLPGESGVVSRKPVFLDAGMLATPGIAMALAKKEVVRMGSMAWQNVELALGAVDDKDVKKITYVLEHEPVVDALEEEITKYLTQMSEQEMNEELSALHTGLLHACNDIERIGDHAENIVKKVRNMKEDGVSFSEDAQEELRHLSKLVLEASSKALKALETDDRALAREALAVSHEVKLYQKEMRKNHVTRLNNKVCNPAAGFVMLELLINMKRVSDHSKNISQLVLGEF